MFVRVCVCGWMCVVQTYEHLCKCIWIALSIYNVHERKKQGNANAHIQSRTMNYIYMYMNRNMHGNSRAKKGDFTVGNHKAHLRSSTWLNMIIMLA